MHADLFPDLTWWSERSSVVGATTKCRCAGWPYIQTFKLPKGKDMRELFTTFGRTFINGVEIQCKHGYYQDS